MSMESMTPLIISLLFLAALLAYAIYLYRDRDRYLFLCKPLTLERDKLKEELERLKRSLPAQENNANNYEKGKTPKNVKLQQHDENATTSGELIQRIKTLKSEIAKIKEENFNLKKDNKTLRQEARDNRDANAADQRETVALREQNANLELALNAAQVQIKTLENLKKELENSETQSKIQDSAQNTEQNASLVKEKLALEASLKNLRAELGSLKKDFNAQLDAAKNEIAQSNKSLKKSLANAQRQAELARQNANNNHRIYLVARAQMMLAERKLSLLDPCYKPILPLPAGRDAIDDTIKKLQSMQARDERAIQESSALHDRIRELELENESLRANKLHDISFGSLDETMTDDSFTALIDKVSNESHETETPMPAETAKTNDVSKQKNLADIDFSDIDEGEWDDL